MAALAPSSEQLLKRVLGVVASGSRLATYKPALLLNYHVDGVSPGEFHEGGPIPRSPRTIGTDAWAARSSPASGRAKSHQATTALGTPVSAATCATQRLSCAAKARFHSAST